MWNKDKQPAIYFLANHRNGTLYIGVTSNLIQRVWQHKQKIIFGFTAKHALTKLIHFELFDTMQKAITREKQLKNWKRQWKVALIEEHNPDWLDLWESLIN